MKLFKKIRSGLLLEGKIGNYLKYAIGEIILVVIGILIAVSINNWNIKNINEDKEAIYLRNIERDLNEQLATIEAQAEYESLISNVATPIINYYKAHQSFKIDSLFTANIGTLIGRKTFVQNAPTFTELLSSGNIDIISDNTLKDEIVKYYQELERNEIIINKNNNLYVDEVFVPQMSRLIEVQQGGTFTTVDNSYITKNKIDIVDLNEERLKYISREILKKPENELMLINNINMRNGISILHIGFLSQLHDKTTKLLNFIKTR